MATSLQADNVCEINGVAMTVDQHATARVFERAGYAVVGHSHGAVVMRARRDDPRHRIELDRRGLVIPWSAR